MYIKPMQNPIATLRTTTSISTDPSAVTALREFIVQHPNLVVLTGAGVSVSSGIPAYRNSNGKWMRNDPIQHRDFIAREASRQRYWARSFAGWPAVSAAQPNTSHQALADLESRGIVDLLVTQNVDRLHQRAGHKKVIDLHGRLDQVVCLDCGAHSLRDDVQARLAQLNPHLQHGRKLYPDGDADVADNLIGAVVIPECTLCGGVLKPAVVFFGDSVDRATVSGITDAIDQASALLVIGSSLMVFSGYRYCRHASERGIPIACINPGTTRADDLFSLKIADECAPVLAQLLESL